MMRLKVLVAAVLVMGLGAALCGAEAEKKAASQPSSTMPYQLIPTKRTDEGALKKHEDFLARAKAGPIGVLFIGDSITAGWGGSAGMGLWKKEFEPLQAANFGIGSDATQHVLWRITEGGELDGIDPKVVVLLIGTNNISGDPKIVTQAVTKIVETIRAKLPKTKVMLLAIFPRAQAKDQPKVMENVKAVNEDLAKLDDGKNVRFVDLGPKLAPGGKVTKEVFADGVHLTEKGYQIWAEGIRDTLKAMMK